MAIAQQSASKRQTLNLRIRPELRSLIDQAAEVTGKNRSEFVLEAAREAAENALQNQVVLAVSLEAYAEFVARLDAAPNANERLRRTLRTPAPWD